MTYSTLSRYRFSIGLAAFVGALFFVFSVAPLQANADILSRQLDEGMTGDDVSALQRFLATDNTIYPQGLVTGFFGPLTFSAVSNFQSRNGIATVGRVGPITLAAINRVSNSIGGSDDDNAPIISNTTVSPTTSSLNVSWTTNEDTQSLLYYSNTPISMTENTANNPDSVSVSGTRLESGNLGLRTSHAVNVQNLQSNSLYYYVIHATDQAGNVSVTWPSVVRTSQ